MPVADARITEVCDAVVAAALAAWTAWKGSAVAAPDGCERTYLVPVKFDRLVGRQVYVSPVSFGDENASRGEDMGAYDVALIVAERYEDAGAPPRAWLDERVSFVETLFDELKDYKPRKNPLLVGTPARRLYTASAAVEEVYAIEYLDKQHCFWAGLTFQFRGINP